MRCRYKARIVDERESFDKTYWIDRRVNDNFPPERARTLAALDGSQWTSHANLSKRE